MGKSEGGNSGVSHAFTVKQPNIFGRIGTGFGQALSENLPKEFERATLSQGLRNLENSDQTPIQQMASIIQSGGSPDLLRQLEPYIRNSQIAQGQKSIGPNRHEQGVTQTPRQNQNMSGQQGQIGQDLANIKQAGPEATQREIIPPPSPQQIDARARELMVEDPQLYRGENAYANATQRATAELNYPRQLQQEDRDANQRRVAQENELRTRFDSKVKNYQVKNIPDELQQIAYKKAEQDILANNKSLEKATEDQVGKLRSMSKNLITLQNSIGGRGFFGSGRGQLEKDIKKLREPFEKEGEQALELFKDRQKTSLDIGDHFASENTWPINSKQSEIIKSSSKEDPKKIAAKLASTINEDSSLFTIGFNLGKSGVDDKAVIEELEDLGRSGIAKLTDRQKREAAEYYSLSDGGSTLGDHLYGAFGLVGLPFKAAFNYITGVKEKVGPVERFKQSLGKE